MKWRNKELKKRFMIAIAVITGCLAFGGNTASHSEGNRDINKQIVYVVEAATEDNNSGDTSNGNNETASTEASTQEITTEEITTEEATTEEVTTEVSSTEEAVVLKGWTEVSKGKWYFYNSGARVAKSAGWYKINNKYYYLKKDGTRVTKSAGWYKINSKYYYLKKDGTKVTKSAGWYKINNKYYYLKKNGSQVTKKAGWYKINSKYYYLKKNGSQVTKNTGWYKVDNKMLYIKKNGTRVDKKAGFYLINNKWYKLAKSGKILAHKDGWQQINGKWYYITSKGTYYTGWKNIGDKRYYFDGKNGNLTEGWFTNGGYEYYQTVKEGIHKNDVVKYKTGNVYYWLNDKGQKYDDELTRYFVKIWVDRSKESMTRSEKLWAFYYYFAEGWNSRFSYDSEKYALEDWYARRDGFSKSTSKKFALEMLQSRKGDCYRWALCFGYMVRMLGYDAYIVSGTLGPTVHHGWTEIHMDGKTYVCDPEVQYKNSWLNLYMQTYDSYVGSGGRKIHAKAKYKIEF
jgi:glucan-binding YG repeat protein